MRKLWILLSACLLSISPTFASAEPTGVYIAPKFIWGFAPIDLKTTGTAGIVGLQTVSGTVSHKKTESLPGGALAIGYDFNPLMQTPIRAELEFSFFKKIDIKHNDQKTNITLGALLVNGYFDIKTDTPFTPYIGVGLGIAGVKTKSTANLALDFLDNNIRVKFDDKTKKNFAWMATVGASYEISETFSLDLGYRFAGFGKGETKNWNESLTFDSPIGPLTATANFSLKTKEIYMHQIILSARLTF